MAPDARQKWQFSGDRTSTPPVRIGGMIRLRSHAAFLARLAWPGAAAGVVLVTVLFAAELAFSLRSGLGTFVDVVIVVVLTGLALALLGLTVMLTRAMLIAWPRLFTAALLA